MKSTDLGLYIGTSEIFQRHIEKGGIFLQYSAIIVFAVIWGGLMFYFLTPIERNTLQSKKGISFKKAFMASLLSGMKHKKIILAFVLLIGTLIGVWLNYAQLEWHNAAHGGGEMTFNPTTQAIYSIVAITIYTVMLYLLSAYKRMKGS